jgi:hypothetical protein
LSFCIPYQLTPSATAPTAGPFVKIRSNTAGWTITVRDQEGAVKGGSVSRADSDHPQEKAANLACSLLWPTSESSTEIPLPPEEVKEVKEVKKVAEIKKVAGPIERGNKKSDKASKAAVAAQPPVPPPSPPAQAPVVSVSRALAPGEQLDGLMPVSAASVCTCSWITDDSDLRSDDARWSFAPDCGTCEPAPPLELREEVDDRRAGGRR